MINKLQKVVNNILLFTHKTLRTDCVYPVVALPPGEICFRLFYNIYKVLLYQLFLRVVFLQT
ncbi:uncharacterized protein METZ01_LOCUS11556 [marine metagenome]|uniref:Uncharacterized protein n=1 Tax=marine metagenome TaxID=408172 RepID=A0A381NVR2_9ZZZZ